MSPTTTDELPPVIACASGVWICRMSHWSGDRGSKSETGVFTTEDVARLWFPTPPLTCVANAAVAAAPRIAPFLITLLRNVERGCAGRAPSSNRPFRRPP